MGACLTLRAPIAAATLAACSTSWSAVESARLTLTEPVVVDLMPNRLPVVSVALDEGPPARFLVDCGAAMSFVDADAAQRLGLRERQYTQPFTVIGVDGAQSQVHRCAYVRRVEVGALALEHAYWPLLESDLLDVQEVDGIFGQDLLARFPLVLDRQRQKLHLLPARMRSAEIQRYLEGERLGSGSWVVATAEFRPMPFLPLEVEGLGPLEIEIDTGAGMTCLPQRAIDALALPRVGGGDVPTLAGTKSVTTYRLRNFQVFGLRIDAEVQGIGDDYGLLGMDVLGELVVVLNAPEKTIWLHRRAVEKRE